MTKMGDGLMIDSTEKDRATGRTTRIVDKLIQELFNNKGKHIRVQDHTNLPSANRMILFRLENRLVTEHPRQEYEISFINNEAYIKLK